MPKKTKREKALSTLKDEDLICLQHIYLYRTLNVEQVMSSIYHLRSTQTRKRNAIIRRLLDLEVVEMIEYRPNEHALFLTNLGIDIVRHTKDIPQEIFDENTKTVKRGYYTAAELKMKKNLMNHQLTKNNFMLKFQKLISSDSFKNILSKNNIKHFKYQYFDEKYLTSYILMRPDAVLHTGNVDFFIEEDMATESAAQLRDKWRHYVEFMQTREFWNKENKIIVLFLTDNIVKEKSLANRKKVVRQTALEILQTKFKHNFDMIVGSQDEILTMLPDLIVESYGLSLNEYELYKNLAKNNWRVSTTNLISNRLNDENYLFYIRQIDKSNKISVIKSRNLEFMLDVYNFKRLAVQARMGQFERDSILFFNEFKRPLQYIVILPSDEKEEIKSIYTDLKQVNAQAQSNLFFTTFERLETLPLSKALFQFSNRTSISHFKNEELLVRINE